MNIGLPDLYLAYRQAKASVHEELRGAGLLEFADFELHLGRNLSALTDRLSGDSWFDFLPSGAAWLTPKSTAKRHNTAPSSRGRRRLEIRAVWTPAVDFLIAEVLFLWKFGALLDRHLYFASVGNRLRLREPEAMKTQHHLFKYWPTQYEAFCEEPLKVARRILSDGGRCTVIGADFASFYDSIDPGFLLTSRFTERLSTLSRISGFAFDMRDYLTATRSLLNAFARYRVLVGQLVGAVAPRGIPIGCITSRVIANLALEPLDEVLANAAGQVCYYRYVDDLSIVLWDDASASLETILPVKQTTRDFIELDEIVLQRPGSALKLRRAKTVIHPLEGPQGARFLEDIAADRRRTHSERRLFVDPAVLQGETLASLAELRRPRRSEQELHAGDGKRMATMQLSSALRALQSVAVLLDPPDARQIAHEALQPVVALLPSTDWVERIENIQRLLRVALLADDTDSAHRIISQVLLTWGDRGALKRAFSSLVWNGTTVSLPVAFECVARYMHRRLVEAIFGSLRVGSGFETSLASIAGLGLSADALVAGARKFAAADLRTLDREDDIIPQHELLDTNHGSLYQQLCFNDDIRRRFEVIGRFLDRCRKSNDWCWGTSEVALFAMTRPLSYFDIAQRWLADAETGDVQDGVFSEISEIVNAARGTVYDQAVGRVVGNRIVHIDLDDATVAPSCRLILGNLVLPNHWYERSIERDSTTGRCRPVHSYSRLRMLSDLLERADFAARYRRQVPGGSLLVLPELALPRKWVRAVATQVSKRMRSFSLITGLEYQHDTASATVRNQALGVFLGPRHSVATWLWTKGYPADKEAIELGRVGLSFPPVASRLQRTIVDSSLGALSVLICSELIEARLLSELVCSTELVVVPSWNPDTASYDHLIQSAGLQMHSIIAIANNACFSDCRVWAPYDERFRRDVCRLVQRDTNEVIWADLPVNELRLAHEKGHSPEWKPLPPGPRRR